MSQLFLTILKRMAALTILKVTGVLAGGSVVGLQLWQAAGLAAFVGCMEVIEALARAYVVDGALDGAEVDDAFGKALDDK